MDEDEKTLRRAADLIRDVGSRATKGVCPEFTWSAVRHIARNCDVHDECWRDGEYDVAKGTGHGCNQWGRYDDSPWIALMDAQLAEPLAAWLDSAATDLEQGGHLDAAPALAVARRLLDAELPR